jgi:hypothetical protein
LYEAHIRDLRSEIKLAEQERDMLAAEMVSDDESSREDSRKFEDLNEHIDTLVSEVRQYEGAIRGVRDKIEVERRRVVEQTIRDELNRRQAYIRENAALMRKELPHRLANARDDYNRARIQDEADNAEAYWANEYDKDFAPRRVMDLDKNMNGHSYNDLRERGDVYVKGIRVPGSEYNSIRDRIEQEMRT